MELQFADVERLVPNLKQVGIGTEGVEGHCTGYQFTGGIYEGVVFTYYNIRFNVFDVEEGKLTDLSHEEVDPADDRYALQVAFEYVTFQNPNEHNTDTKTFKEHLGAILVQLIEGSLDG